MRIKNLKKNNIVKEQPKEIKSLNWFDKNKCKEILSIIDSNEFNYKNIMVTLSILTLTTWLIILNIIQLVK